MYTDIQKVDDALTVIGADPKDLEILNSLSERARNPAVNYYLLTSVIEAVNMLPEDETETRLEAPWIPDFTDGTYKYILWPDVEKDESKPSGFGLSCDDYGSTGSDTYAGSRLTFRSRSRAKHVFNYFRPLVEAVYLIDRKKTLEP